MTIPLIKLKRIFSSLKSLGVLIKKEKERKNAAPVILPSEAQNCEHEHDVWAYRKSRFASLTTEMSNHCIPGALTTVEWPSFFVIFNANRSVTKVHSFSQPIHDQQLRTTPVTLAPSNFIYVKAKYWKTCKQVFSSASPIRIAGLFCIQIYGIWGVIILHYPENFAYS